MTITIKIRDDKKAEWLTNYAEEHYWSLAKTVEILLIDKINELKEK